MVVHIGMNNNYYAKTCLHPGFTLLAANSDF